MMKAAERGNLVERVAFNELRAEVTPLTTGQDRIECIVIRTIA